ncbi:hypothetical protein EYF80_061458 [Liparis tanakae]|uniref:Uncharacterized protein n=1 Tax=Liparis tanakae TaxID=230148 RepID=A0A4Z2EIY5_9TELE|nr:hypothetical protein EYF80_061458 [Liparis tanakae]
MHINNLARTGRMPAVEKLFAGSTSAAVIMDADPRRPCPFTPTGNRLHPVYGRFCGLRVTASP